MSEANKAVFLSYAPQDAEAAKCICDALRNAGVKVWFDQIEPMGGGIRVKQARGGVAHDEIVHPAKG